jgi:hypothetical protein
MKPLHCRTAAAIVAATVIGGCGQSTRRGVDHSSRSAPGAAASAPRPLRRIAAGRLVARPHPATRDSPVSSRDLFTNRVFIDANVGFALANVGNAQYPAVSRDGGRTWRIDGPQVHVDAADGPEGVGYVGAAAPRTFFAYGSSAVDVTTDGGATWWEALPGELVTAVVAPVPGLLVAYVQQSVSNDHVNPAVSWEYVSQDGGRHWTYSTDLGGMTYR